MFSVVMPSYGFLVPNTGIIDAGFKGRTIVLGTVTDALVLSSLWLGKTTRLFIHLRVLPHYTACRSVPPNSMGRTGRLLVDLAWRGGGYLS